MGSWSRTSLYRWLFGAALVAGGFLLASSTEAWADEEGLLGTVLATQPSVGQLLESTTEAAGEASESVLMAPVEEVVASPVGVVANVAGQPVAALDAAASTAVSSTTAVVSAMTADVDRAVETLLPTVGQALDPVAAIIAPAEDEAGSGPVTDLPDAGPDVPEPADETSAPTPDGGVLAQLPSALPAALAGIEPAGWESATASGVNRDGGVRSSAVRSSLRPLGHPDHVVPAPGLGILGVASGQGSTGSPTSGGADHATSPLTPTIPRNTSVATPSGWWLLPPSPVMDLGSRPG